MELWMWIIVVALTVGGFVYGLILGRSRTDDSELAKSKARSLEGELSSMKEEFGRYREDVNSHFQTTAELIQHMTDSYKAVYRHLASGSQQLCSGQVMLDLDEAPRLASGSNGAEKSSTESASQEEAHSAKKRADASAGDARTFH